MLPTLTPARGGAQAGWGRVIHAGVGPAGQPGAKKKRAADDDLVAGGHVVAKVANDDVELF